MNDAIAQRITQILITLAAAMVICPALFKSSGASYGLTLRDRTASFASESRILFKRGVLDTDARADLDTSAEDLRPIHITSAAGSAKRLTRVVQFAGPIKREWFDALTATGAKVVGYVANNAYIVRGTAAEIARVASLDRDVNSSGDRPIRWMGNLRALDKIDPAFTDEMLAGQPTRLNVEIELTETDESSDVVYAINLAASNVNREPRRFLNFLAVSVSIDSSSLLKNSSTISRMR